jgi:phosphoribosylformimino-5-aminoimidazole carboxamide ribotide isomerase
MFQVIGVIDLRGGRAVRARGGHRERYAPVDTVAGVAIEAGDAAGLARHFVDGLGVPALYTADLDAIVDRRPQRDVIERIAAIGAPLWLDAGITTPDEARAGLDSGATHLVVGLETLPSLNALESICAAAGGHRVAFSLDLRDGQPIAASVDLAQRRPEELVREAAKVGVNAVIVLDLARVGLTRGVDLDLIARLRAAVPDMPLIAGGGVRGRDDLAALQSAGCRGALVATALLDGQLTADDIAYLLAID